MWNSRVSEKCSFPLFQEKSLLYCSRGHGAITEGLPRSNWNKGGLAHTVCFPSAVRKQHQRSRKLGNVAGLSQKDQLFSALSWKAALPGRGQALFGHLPVHGLLYCTQIVQERKGNIKYSSTISTTQDIDTLFSCTCVCFQAGHSTGFCTGNTNLFKGWCWFTRLSFWIHNHI